MSQMHPKVLLIDNPAENDSTLWENLEAENIALLRGKAGDAGFSPEANPEADILLVDARVPNLRLETFLDGNSGIPAANAAFYSIVFLVDRTPPLAPADQPEGPLIEYFPETGGAEDIIACLRRHIRFVKLKQENQRLRERLNQIHKRATVGAVADAVAHNINNVLGILFGYIHLLKTHYDKPDTVLEHQKNIENAVNRLTDLVNRLGTAARETAAPPRRILLSELLQQSIDYFRSQTETNPSFDLVLEDPNLVLHTRSSQIEDVIIELLKNAWESYGDIPEEKRRIEISTRTRKEGEESLLELRIRDWGTGISPDIQAAMFEPFKGTKQSSGLGLTLARRCFRNLGGNLSITENPEGGTIVEATCPL